MNLLYIHLSVDDDRMMSALLVLQVCDSILNIGPCANASMGEPAFLSEEVSAENNVFVIFS